MNVLEENRLKVGGERYDGAVKVKHALCEFFNVVSLHSFIARCPKHHEVFVETQQALKQGLHILELQKHPES